MSAITIVTGDATAPPTSGLRIIVHICNDVGAWGKGFVLAVSRRWKEPERVFRAAFAGAQPPALGEVQFVPVADDLLVANLIGQRDIVAAPDGTPPIRYEAVRAGLERVAAFAAQRRASIHMPRIGCGLAGGTWDRIEAIIAATLLARGIAVAVYDLP